jgi:hypothetical protein
VLVVVASSQDRVASRLVERWGADHARLMTCRDLSRPGWRYQPGKASSGVAVIGGQRVRAADIDGILVRLPYIPPAALPHIVSPDRTYVAREMTAFLTAWLSDVPCRVVNRPTAVCLAGPGWTAEQWRHTAARLGIRMLSRRRRAHTLTVIGGAEVGFVAGAATARRLAEAAGVDLLDVHFDQQQRVVSVDPWPDVARPDVADVLLEWFRSR